MAARRFGYSTEGDVTFCFPHADGVARSDFERTQQRQGEPHGLTGKHQPLSEFFTHGFAGLGGDYGFS